MPDFKRWWWEQVFRLADQIETRDVLVLAGAVGFFVLIWTGRIQSEHLAAVIAAVAGYAAGRPNSRREDK